MKILYATSEAAPYWTTGGLADVSRALPDALARRGHDVAVVHPFYPAVAAKGFDLEPAGELEVPWPGGPLRARLLVHASPGGAVTVFVDEPDFFGVERPYEPGPIDPWGHVRRFAFFSRAVLEIARARTVDVIHLNDWPTGLVAAYAAADGNAPATVFAIHNLAHQGNFPPALLHEIGIPASFFRIENGVEFHGQASCMKAGLALADRLVTVSPTYAAEIQTEELGAGFHGLLRFRRRLLHGILNGIDTATWNPETDPHLPAHYSADDLSGKEENRKRLMREFRLDPRGPLLIMVTRLAHQKGVDLTIEALPRLLERRARLLVLGDGDPDYQDALALAAAAHPRRVAARFGFDDPLAHRMFAAADFIVMPSRFEPCGLGQLIAQRYGTIPIARATGGLADTVEDGVTGYTFAGAAADDLVVAARRAIGAWRSEADVAMRVRCMRLDRSWGASAARYEVVYRLAMGSLGPFENLAEIARDGS